MWDGVDIADGAVEYMNGQQPCGALTHTAYQRSKCAAVWGSRHELLYTILSAMYTAAHCVSIKDEQGKLKALGVQDILADC